MSSQGHVCENHYVGSTRDVKTNEATYLFVCEYCGHVKKVKEMSDEEFKRND